MSDPREQHDELDLEAESVRDLEPDEDGAEDVRGGRISTAIVCTCLIPK